MNGLFNSYLKKKDGRLIHTKTGEEARYREFVDSIPEDTVVDVFMEVNEGTGSLGQLAKVHKCIRILADDLGYTFEEMKLVIKDRAGLFVKRSIDGKDYFDWKSFGSCSKEDLNLAIQACIELGDEMGINLR